MSTGLRILTLLLAVLCWERHLRADSPARSVTREDAKEVLRRSITAFTGRAAIHGGYLWQYSVDFREGRGEENVTPETVWVQAPGTPAVGMSLLLAYDATEDPSYLALAREAAEALRQGQLVSGGWDYRIVFSPADRVNYAYRVATEPPSRKARNVTTLDDDNTQLALRFLMDLDHRLRFKDAAIHDTVMVAWQKLLDAQYPNGAWPQRFELPPDPAEFPVLAARYPEQWSREFPKQDYRSFYTFNDQAMTTMVTTLLQADAIYRDDRFLKAALRTGDFILSAQMPEPQPAWAQQYNARMEPAWARKFEPPAITGGESQAILRVLLTLYQRTGERRFLRPIEPALQYLEKSVLADGQLARFYELKTNRPLYFTTQYTLTYDDQDLPTHYGFKVENRLAAIRDQYQSLLKKNISSPTRDAYRPWSRMKPNESLTAKAAKAISSLNRDGLWIEEESVEINQRDYPRHIDTGTFVRNVRILSDFIRAE